MKNKLISIIAFIGTVIYLGASFYWEILPKWITFIPFIIGIIPVILSFMEDKKEKENKIVLRILKENQTVRKDLSDKEKEAIAERMKNKEWEVAINSLKNKSLLKENIIRKYSNPLPIIIFQYGNQKIKNRTNKFITEKLERDYNVKSLGGSLKVIPPNKVPKNIKNGMDLKKWFKSKIQSKYKDSSCVVSILAIVDLKNVYWKSDYYYEVRYFKSLGNVLGLEDIFDKGEIPKLVASENVSVLEPIISGDIAFLTSNFLSDKELTIIHRNQEDIEKKLGHPSLEMLSQEATIQRLSKILSKYFNNSDKIALRINKEAKYWNNKLMDSKNEE